MQITRNDYFNEADRMDGTTVFAKILNLFSVIRTYRSTVQLLSRHYSNIRVISFDLVRPTSTGGGTGWVAPSLPAGPQQSNSIDPGQWTSHRGSTFNVRHCIPIHLEILTTMGLTTMGLERTQHPIRNSTLGRYALSFHSQLVRIYNVSSW